MSNMGFIIMHQLTLLVPNLRYHPQLGILAGIVLVFWYLGNHEVEDVLSHRRILQSG